MACTLLLRSFSAVTLFLYAVLLHEAHALWPQPFSGQIGSQALRLDHSFHIDVEIGVQNPPDDLLAAVQRTRKQLFNEGASRLTLDRGASDLPVAKAAKVLPSLELTFGGDYPVRPIATEAQRPLDLRDEAYTITVPADGSPATLTANSTLGLFRGLMTFSQMWYTVEDTVYKVDVPVAISDRPVYVRIRPSFSWCDGSRVCCVLCVAVSGLYVGYRAKLVCPYCAPVRAPGTATYHHLSFPLSDIRRTLDACSWVHVRRIVDRHQSSANRLIQLLHRSIRSTGTSRTARASHSSFLASLTLPEKAHIAPTTCM